MIRQLRLAFLVAAFVIPQGSLQSQDNPVLDKLVAKKIKDELSKMNSPQTGYRNGPHWLYLDDPKRNLSVQVTAKQAGNRLQLAGSANGKIAFNYQVEVTQTILGRRIVWARHDFGGYADAKLVLDASAIPGKQLTGATVKIKKIEVRNLRMRSDAAKPFQGLIQNWVNDALRKKSPDFERQLAAALNTVRP